MLQQNSAFPLDDRVEIAGIGLKPVLGLVLFFPEGLKGVVMDYIFFRFLLA